jgi:starch synthase (maltosyl-transferring)
MAKRSTKTQTATVDASALDPQLQRRVVVENIRPQVDGGRFPIKRVIGEAVTVRADVFGDGHDLVAAVVRDRAPGTGTWRETPMEPLGNDEWRAVFTVDQLGTHAYTVEAWIDRFGSWRHEVSKKFGAGQDVSSELLEGATLVRAAAARPGDPFDSPDSSARSGQAEAGWLKAQAALLEDASADVAERVGAALADRLHRVMASRADRSLATRPEPALEVLVERERARVGAWYEMFPRSAGTDPARSATFDEAALKLHYVASLGFDVLYLPPIHPIGRAFRKGPNNSLEPGPDDPGSPWAIGSREGGHTAIEPGLGTLEDFDRFVESAARLGLEIALDLAYQVSPDHPYVREHPEWFRHRPDGTIKYAENPPKKYQDIYPINFESEAWPELWRELKAIVEFWVGHGVRIFRVDNPHTKPFRFWEWALGDIHRAHPDVIFLSEAFTRPKVMRYLAKTGFSQSYTYFTWRNSKAELTEYLTELTQTDVREYMRPNFFANTPDILHEYLQRGGPPAFRIRFVLAATLAASYGIYSGYELFEHVPIRQGSEEYIDSEKYQIRTRDFTRTPNLGETIARVNAIRRRHPALQHDWGLQFHQTDNPELLCYSKRSVDGANLILVVVNLDPFHMQHGFVHLPVWDWGLGADATFEVLDLLSDERYYWRGERNYVRLDPEIRVAHILRVHSPAQA